VPKAKWAISLLLRWAASSYSVLMQS